MKPLLLLLPGMLNDARVWQPVVAQIADAAEIRIADMTRDTTIAQVAERAWAQLADLPPQRRLVVAGFSMGGYTALQMLDAPQRRVDALALIDTSARPDTPERTVLREQSIAAIEHDYERFIDGLAKFATHSAFQADADAMHSMRTMMHGIGAATAVAQHRAVMARRDQREFVRTIELPTVVMVGTEDRITPPEFAEELAALIPGAKLLRLAECGHMAPLERPQQVAQALRSLLHRPRRKRRQATC